MLHFADSAGTLLFIAHDGDRSSERRWIFFPSVSSIHVQRIISRFDLKGELVAGPAEPMVGAV